MIFPMVNVVWLDTNECSLSVWQSKDELMEAVPCTIDSLGYLITENDKFVTISG